MLELQERKEEEQEEAGGAGEERGGVALIRVTGEDTGAVLLKVKCWRSYMKIILQGFMIPAQIAIYHKK